jgi:peptide/nickel transport system substrate-binding protein
MISQTAFEGSGLSGASMISPVVWGAIDLPPFEYNIERAKELMAEAGYPDGFSTVLMWSPYDAQYAQVSQMIQSQLRDIGIEITLQSIEWGAFLDAVYAGEQEMFLLSWYTPTVDPEYGLYGLSYGGNANGGNNLANFIDPRIDSLLMEGRSSLDNNRRLAVYAELQQIIRDEAAYLFYHYTEELHVARPDIDGFVVNPIGQHDMWRVTFD